jgi:phage FluMu protein gp41
MAKRIKKKAEAEAFGKVLEQVTVEFTLKVGAKGKSFGSVTTRDIETSLKALGYEIDRRQIRLAETIKGPGVYKVEVKLHSEVTVDVQVKVIAAQAPVSAAGAQEKGKKKSKSKKGEESDSVEGEETLEGSADTEETES